MIKYGKKIILSSFKLYIKIINKKGYFKILYTLKYPFNV